MSSLTQSEFEDYIDRYQDDFLEQEDIDNNNNEDKVETSGECSRVETSGECSRN